MVNRSFASLARTVLGVLAIRLALLLLVYSLCRVVFFALNRDLFADVTASELGAVMLGGLRFDLSAILYVNFFYFHLMLVPLRVRHHRITRWGLDSLFVVTNAVALAANCADFVYFRFTLRRTTAEVFSEFSHEEHLGRLLLQLLAAHWQVALALALVLGLLLLLVRLTPIAEAPLITRRALYYGAGVLLFPVGSLLVIAGCRGGFFSVSHRPINNSNALAYVDKPQHAALVLNTPFSLIRTIDKEPLEARHYYASEPELEAAFTPEHHYQAGGDEKRRNVVILILESFGPNAIGFLNRDLENGTYKGYTPFLDSLSKECLAFPNAFANGLHSIEALPSIVASVPSFKQRFVTSHYATNRVNGLATLLRSQGYHTAFFHGAPDGSMGFDAFARLAGFEEYYGANEYNNPADLDGAWGIWDEEFLQYFARTLGKFSQPFFGAVFTLSSHSPFYVPPRYEGKFPAGPSRAHAVMGYADYALKRFFETAATMPWYQDTLFVITADHSAARTHPEYATTLGRFRVPFLLCAPGDPRLRGWDEAPVQHVDIMPTVLHYVGFSGDFVAFGQDVLDKNSERMAFNYHPGGPYEMVRGEYLLDFDGDKSLALYRYTRDRLLLENLLAELPEVAQPMEAKVKAVIQQYNSRMREDRLVPGARGPKR